MKLIDLEPRWIHSGLFVFLCPHCLDVLLACKEVEMSVGEQIELFEREFGEGMAYTVVPAREGMSWSISGTIPRDPKAAFITDLTVNPSIDASASGHWHGHIQNGEIVGGDIKQ